MADQRVTRTAGDYVRRFFTEDGQNYRRETQDFRPTMKHVEQVRHKHEHATRASNPNQWEHRGSIPMTLLVDWLQKHGYAMDQWARNDGGDPYKINLRGGGVKDKFMAHFMSRDYSKLHNSHVTTKRGTSQILMPGDYSWRNEVGGAPCRSPTRSASSELKLPSG